jgi:hypothetical protein
MHAARSRRILAFVVIGIVYVSIQLAVLPYRVDPLGKG